MNPFYDKKAIIKGVCWLLALVAACKLTMGAAVVVMIPVLIAFALQGKDEALMYVLLVAVCFMVTNAYFVPKGFVFAVSQKVLMLVSAMLLATQVFGRRQSSLVTPMLLIVPYILFMAVSSQSGWSPVISNLKLLLFSMIFFALYGCSVKVMGERTDIRKMRSMVLCIAMFYILGSVLVIPFPSISIMSAAEVLNNPGALSLFKGVTNHSQALGPIVTFFGVFLFADYVFSIQRKDKLYGLILLCVPFLIYKTFSRTAMASYLGGMAFVVFCAMRSNSIMVGWRRRIVNGVLTVVMLGSLAVLVLPPLRDKVGRFVLKYSNSGAGELTSESIWKSRQSKLNTALENWRESPVVGNGFQVSEEMRWRKVDGIRDMLTAPVEKSTWTYAVLEEGGVIGLILFILFLLVGLLLLMRRKAYIGAAMLVELGLVNMGEFVVFSMSALGGVMWCLLFVGLAFDHKRLEGARRRVWMSPHPSHGMMPWIRP